MVDDQDDEVLADLQTKRAAYAKNVERLDALIEAWIGIRNGSPSERAPRAQPTPTTARRKQGPRRSVRKRTGKPSIKTRVVALLDEADRIWTAPEIVAEQMKRGDPVHHEGVADKSSPVRTALINATQEGLLVKLDKGRYKSAKFSSVIDGTPDMAPDVPAGKLPWNQPTSANGRPTEVAVG